MISPLCAADRRNFYRTLSWLMQAWVIMHIVVLGDYRNTDWYQPPDTNEIEQVVDLDNMENWFLAYQYTVLLFSCLFLDFSLHDSERYIKLSCVGYVIPSPELSLRCFSEKNSYWLMVLLSAQTITPYLILVQYLTAYYMYYRTIPFMVEVSFLETAPASLFYMWLMACFACYDCLTQLGWQFACSLLYRKKWFSYIYGPPVYKKRFGLLVGLDDFPDWVFFNYLFREV